MAKAARERQGILEDPERKAEIDRLGDVCGSLILGHKFEEAREVLSRARSSVGADPRLEALAKRIAFAERVLQMSRFLAQGKWSAASTVGEALAREDPNHPEVSRLQFELERLTAKRSSVEAERLGIKAFYAARYEDASLALQTLAVGPERSAKAMFYLACSNAALALLHRDQREALLKRARRQFADAKMLDGTLASNVAFVSPRILRALQEDDAPKP